MRRPIFVMTASFVLIIQSCAEMIPIDKLVGNQTFTITGDYGGDDVDQVNQVWFTYQPVELIVRSFQIDVQSGDFVLLSKYALEWDPDANKPKLPTREYTLLMISEEFVNEFNTTVQMINPDGVSIYFHGALAFDRRQFQQGFTIEVGLIDKTEPEPPTTTENIIPAPDPGEDQYYVIKFIVGKHPSQFLTDLSIFKRHLANMTNDYCQANGITLLNDAGDQDVSVPTSSLRYCDRSWPPYDTCVEASFAVEVYDGSRAYVMNAPRLNEMWATYSAQHGYSDYQPPDDDEISRPALWLTVFLGFIIVLLPLLCVLWLKQWSDENQRDSGVFESLSTMTDGTEGPGRLVHYDIHSPGFGAPTRREFDGMGLGADNLGLDSPVERQNSIARVAQSIGSLYAEFNGDSRAEEAVAALQAQADDHNDNGEEEVQHFSLGLERPRQRSHFDNDAFEDDNGNSQLY